MPTGITIAADSKQMITSPAGAYLGYQSGCKIYEAHGLVFALAGLTYAEGISVVDEIKDSIPLTEQATGRKLPLESVLIAGETSIVKVLKAQNATSNRNMPIQLLVAGPIDGELRMVRVDIGGMAIQGDYSIPTSTRRITYPEDRGYNGSNRDRGVEILGIGDTARKFQAILPDWNLGDDVGVANRLVAIEASDSTASQFVGAPISTIVVNRDGAKLINKGLCDWSPAKPSDRASRK